MKWPWEKRAESAEQEAKDAEQAYVEVEDQWDRTIHVAESAKAQREMNGWTNKVLDIFAG